MLLPHCAELSRIRQQSRQQGKIPKKWRFLQAGVKCGPWGGSAPSVLTTGLSIGTGLDEEDVERRREVPGGLVLLVSLVKGHEQVLLDRQGGLGKDREREPASLGREQLILLTPREQEIKPAQQWWCRVKHAEPQGRAGSCLCWEKFWIWK